CGFLSSDSRLSKSNTLCRRLSPSQATPPPNFSQPDRRLPQNTTLVSHSSPVEPRRRASCRGFQKRISASPLSIASLRKDSSWLSLWFCQLEMCRTWLSQNSSGVRHGGGARQEKRFVFWERRRRGSIGDEFETSVVFWGRRWPGWEKLGGGVAWEGERRRRSVFDLERRESELRN
ncbi:hypothetical protein Drorol1_Dr00027912, partial [Drosera rotundifolia]